MEIEVVYRRIRMLRVIVRIVPGTTYRAVAEACAGDLSLPDTWPTTHEARSTPGSHNDRNNWDDVIPDDVTRITFSTRGRQKKNERQR
jgi:hypothetical protein